MQRPSGARECSKVRAASRWVWLDCGPGPVPSVTRRFFPSTYYAPGTCEALDAAEEREPQSSGRRDEWTCGRVSLSAWEGKEGGPRSQDLGAPGEAEQRMLWSGHGWRDLEAGSEFRPKCLPSPHVLAPGASAGKASSWDTGLR